MNKEVKEYIKHQLSKISKNTPRREQVYLINGIYAVLEERGYEQHQIKLMIEDVVCNNIYKLTKDLQKIIEERDNI